MLRPGALVAVPLLALSLTPPAAGQSRPEAKDMALVGFNDLQARSAYQPTIHNQGGRWIAYIGHHGGTKEAPKPRNPLTGAEEFNGTSLIDVTDPRRPKYLAHIPGDEGLAEDGGAQMVRVCDGKGLPKGDRRRRLHAAHVRQQGARDLEHGRSREAEARDAARAASRARTRTGGSAIPASPIWSPAWPGWRVDRMTEVYDLSDPMKPVKIRDFALIGQQPGAAGPTPTRLHGAISLGPKANRIYFAYGTNEGGVLQIVDREKLITGAKEPTVENLLYPQVGRLDMSPLTGAHTAFPVLEMPVAEFAKDKVGKVRNFVVVTNEQIKNECEEPRQFVWMVDVTVERHPASVSTWGVPEASGGFCGRGGRFGTHASNESFTPIYYKRLMFFSHFNAGVRAVDIRDPYRMKEVAYYIPAVTKNTDKRCIKLASGEERCKVAIQTNNVEVDDRGYIYAVDRANTGMHILELTGPARRIANFPR